MPVYVNRTVGSIGVKPGDMNTGDTPLGIYQKQEVDQLIQYLPDYGKSGVVKK